MRKHALISKPQFGTGVYEDNRQRFKNKSDNGKVSTWVPALKAYIMLLPGTDLSKVTVKYQAQKSWERKSLRVN